LGAHVFAAASAGSIRRDVWVTMGAGLLTSLLLFLVVFRSLGVLLGVLLPIAGGAVVATGVFGWAGVPLHAMTLAFGTVMIGIGIDYGTYLVVHYRARRSERPEEPVALAMPETLGTVFGSLTMGALTTLAAFVVLALSQ